MNPVILQPFFASGALQFAFEKATIEGKITIGVLIVVSLFSWSVIITKIIQLWRASRAAKRFFAEYRATRDPMDLFNKQKEFDGAPVFEVYHAGAQELAYQLKNNPVEITPIKNFASQTVAGAETDMLARSITTKISVASFESVRVSLEQAASEQAMALEKGMIILSTAVAGGPFIGLLGTVWGVMETFSGIAKAASASLTAMAPGVAGALIATVVGLFVAIPAMFAYNYMITTIRGITQVLDNFNAGFATAIEHKYVDNRSVASEIVSALRSERAGRETNADPEKQPEGDLDKLTFA